MFEGLLFRGDDVTRWNLGKGTNLTANEIDLNMWALIQRILGIENDPPEAVSVDHITVVGTEMRVFLTDATELGPFTLPVSSFAWRGVWASDVFYNELDIVVVEDLGIFMVLHDHESASEFDDGEANSEGPLYHQLFGVPTIYDLGFFVPGQPGVTETVGRPLFVFVATRPFYIEAGAPGSQAHLGFPPTTSEATNIPLQKNGTSIGSIDIALGDNVGVYTFPDAIPFAIGDRLEFIRPASIDPDAEDLSITIAARRGLPV